MILQTALLATTKVAERTLSSGVLEHPSDSRYGKILYVIDIPLPQVIGDAVEKAIVSTIQSEYFDTERRSPLYQFEDCIKQINLALAELAEAGHNDWVGHVHACVVLWAENELFVTHAGRVLGVVARAGALVSFIDVPSNERRVLVHKTFANLTSGQLSADDTIVLGNGELARHFSPQFLSQIANASPTESIQSMQAVARRLNLRFVTAIVGLVRETEDDAERIQTPTILLENNADAASSISGVYASTLRAAKEAGGSKLVKTATSNLFKVGSSTLVATKQAFKALRATIAPKKPAISYDDPTEIPIQGTSVHEMPTPAPLTTPLLARPFSQKLSHTLARLLKTINRYRIVLIHYLQQIPPKVLLAIGIICIGIVLISAFRRTGPNNLETPSKQHIAAQVTQVNTILDTATKDAATKPDQARGELSPVQAMIDKIRASGDTNAATRLQDRYTKLIGQLNNVTIISSSVTTALDSKTADIVVIGQYLFSTRQNSNQLFRQTLGQANSSTPVFSFTSSVIHYMALVDEERKLLIGTTDNKLYRISIDNQVTAQELSTPTGESWLPFSSIAAYGDNLYLLELGTGVIWKYTSRDSIVYATKQTYLANQSLASPNYTSVVSDGFIYALARAGSVTKFLKGAPQSFGPTTIPKPGDTFQNASHIFTNQNTASLFIQDVHRLVEITKDGQYVRQYVLSSGTISTSFVSPKTKRAWFFTGNQLLETSL